MQRREYTLVTCTFEHELRTRAYQSQTAKTYTYITNSTVVKAEDTVVVKSPSTGLTCVKVVKVERVSLTYQEANAYKWVYICLPTEYTDLVEKEITKWRESEKLEQQAEQELEKAIQDAVRSMHVQELAKNNPQVAAAYAKLQSARGITMNAEATPASESARTGDNQEEQKSVILGFFTGL